MTVLEEGVDVSRYNGVIQWPAVYQAGKRFAIVRLGSSNANGPYLDPYFNDNVKQAQAAGLRVGAYYYTYASSEEEVIGELNVLLPALEGHRLEYPVYVDVESKELAQLGRERSTQLVRFAMDILDQKGWFPGYYSYTNYLGQYLDYQQLADYPLWVADYRGYLGHPGEYGMWQYSSVGQVPGISTNVDLDYSYVDYLPIIRQQGKNGYGSQTECLEDEYRERWLAAQSKLDAIEEILNR